MKAPSPGSPYSNLPPHNPAVEPQRAGWAIRDEDNDRFLVAVPSEKAGIQWGKAANAYVYTDFSIARYQAGVISCVVVTAPRFNGHCYEWTAAEVA